MASILRKNGTFSQRENKGFGLSRTQVNKYLATMVNGSHFSSISETNMEGVNEFLKGFRPDLGRDYLKALTLAFFNVHVTNNARSKNPI